MRTAGNRGWGDFSFEGETPVNKLYDEPYADAHREMDAAMRRLRKHPELLAPEGVEVSSRIAITGNLVNAVRTPVNGCYVSVNVRAGSDQAQVIIDKSGGTVIEYMPLNAVNQFVRDNT